MTRKEKIAVVGAGPTGLTCASDLALRGYKVTVFEELSETGRHAALGVSGLPIAPDILESEIDDIRTLGVEIRLHTPDGQGISFEPNWKRISIMFISVPAHTGARKWVSPEKIWKTSSAEWNS